MPGMQRRERTNKRVCVGMVVRNQNILALSLFHNFSAVHNGNIMTGLRDRGNVMRDHNNADVEFILQSRQQLNHLPLRHHVQSCGWFVGNQDLRTANQRQRNHRALLHASGKLMRILHKPGFCDADALKQILRALNRFLARYILMLLQGIDNLIADLLHRVERRHRILENNRDFLPADFADFIIRRRHKIRSIQEDLAFGNFAVAREQPHQRKRRC